MNCPDLIQQQKKVYTQSPLDQLQIWKKLSPNNPNIDKSCKLKSTENPDIVNQLNGKKF